jgi:pyruvate/2-oxoglutarate dehydrogenase complex dihydrolipoamide dehydrogenase (E3) component
MPTNKHILVIGGGPAGIQAALAASGSGRHVTLVSDGPPGGRSAWQTLLPSKMWLNARPAGSAGPHCTSAEITELHTRYEHVVGAWQRQLINDLELAGVDLRLGQASFLSPREIEVVPPEGGYHDQISADAVIIATGAVPFVPPGLTPDGERIFSPHMIWKLNELPESMIVIGAGGPATEYVDAFSRLGVQITWITGPVGVLSAFPPDAGHFISGVMARRGVRIFTGMMARQIDRTQEGVRIVTADGAAHEAKMAFIAIGLRPDLGRLNLAAAGLKAGSSGGLATDPFYRTAAEHIYLVGDAASPLSANISIAQGRLAGWHAAGLEVEPLQLENAVMAIYTDPQVAVVGRMSDRVQPLQKIRVPFSTCLRAHLLPQTVDPTEMGFLEIAYDSSRRITGALAVCPEAAEVLTPLAIAVRTGMTLSALASVYPAHPTFSELSILAARMVKN